MAWSGIGPALATAKVGQVHTLWGRVADGRLWDATGAVTLIDGDLRVGKLRVDQLPDGSVGSVTGVLGGAGLRLLEASLRPVQGLAALGAAGRRVPHIARRFAVVERLRLALGQRGYREVDTPLLLEAAGTDPFIEPLVARLAPTWNPAVPTRDLALHTSPELELKRLLALGFPSIFAVAHVFRQGDLSPLHEPEFTMAEWYRVGFGARELGAELVELCTDVAQLPPVVEHTVAELCREAAGVDVLDLQTGTQLSRALGGPEEPFIHAFSRLWVDRVEALLASKGAVLVTRWPAALGMLARLDPADQRVAERFELVVDGLELANGFAELTDPVEQRQRFEQDRAWRAAEGLPDAPIPERFLRALDAGLPPCAGVAVGVDRLAMVATRAPALAELLASPLTERVTECA